jgi:hypothetical protein
MKKILIQFCCSLLILSICFISPVFANHVSSKGSTETYKPISFTKSVIGIVPDVGNFVSRRSIRDILQQAYLKASNTEADDEFGYSVAVSGDTLVIGARGEDSVANSINGDQENNDAFWAGAAYVYMWGGDDWTFQTYLKASNSDPGDHFGYAVAISGDTIVVGAPYEDSNATTVNGNQADNSLEGAGAAYVFVREGETWTQQAYLKPHNSGALDCFGESVDISGDTVVVGARREDGVSEDSEYDEGAAYVFVRDDSSWSQQAYLKASNADQGDLFGYSVAISGHQIVVGATFADTTETNSGAAYVFQRGEGDWSEQVQLIASNPDQGDYFGNSVDISGDTIVVGANCEASSATGVNGDQDNNDADHSGAAYVFALDEDTWSQQAYLKASNTETEDRFGYSVAVSGDAVLVGAFGEDSSASGFDGNPDDNSASEAGAAFLFTRSHDTWSQNAYLKASNSDVGDRFGWSVDLSVYNLLVSAYHEDSNATGVDGDGGNNDAQDSGAAYTFEVEPDYVLFLPIITK